MTQREAIISLNMLPGIGPVRVRALMSHFGNAAKILNSSASQLTQVQGIGPQLGNHIASWQEQIDLEKELEEAAQRGIQIITQDDPSYPQQLLSSHDPPLVLYVWGELKEIHQHSIAIVGSRRTTMYGTQQAKKMAFQLASAGFTIVSGLARGIDTSAHEGAVAAQGQTIAIIGSGLAQLYPPENMALAEKIAHGHGAVISEFPLHTPPSKKSFPMRNRIVASWVQALLVAECPSWSGARITANMASDLGKSIFAIPGPIDRPSSAGCNELIREGATLVTDGQDIIDDMSMLPIDLSRLSQPAAAQASGSQKNAEASDSASSALTATIDALNDDEKSIYQCLADDELSIDHLVEKTQLSSSLIASSLIKLEIKSLIKKLPGGHYQTIR
ncbi:DNA-processing protein DprA [Persicirhabdus sediminis]|uniref:DNA-protecting protein DprA n=1 Tax=Persicirhabdus sediminis TaxID=454144 RepID=A0A8J7ME49_9BACT|nr:DNA-processing protein DprA [Persicirhabdus sediminis]MBK1791337.1 DNA-protecting protein DprA [Persicirhabdus sediminis]